ncbi:hypothetical protein [Streptomyces sp. SBT349]|uniref:hypothetical protein n=1 Tax=Streptomyces sp. SBT349 TaxID=1580539 RepID=UPI00069F1DE2|nr:hypothetical protein [Streptomyces sp. SBT349]
MPSFLPEVLPAAEIGRRLGRPSRGTRVRTEAAPASPGFGSRARGLDRVISVHQGPPARARVLAHEIARDAHAAGTGTGRPVADRAEPCHRET